LTVVTKLSGAVSINAGLQASVTALSNARTGITSSETGGQDVPPVWPCPDCGAKKGEPHKQTCRRARRTRQKGFGALPSWKQGRYEKHTCKPVVHLTRGTVQYLRCGTCRRPMGKRAKKELWEGGEYGPASAGRKDRRISRGAGTPGSTPATRWSTKLAVPSSTCGAGPAGSPWVNDRRREDDRTG
jgi:hypothetical protein